VNNAASPAVRITNSGNVGIAQPNPLYKLSISGGSSFNSQLQISYDGTDTGAYLYADNGGGASLTSGVAYQSAWLAKSTYASIQQLFQGNFIFYTNSGLTVGGSYTPTERMRITSAGLVGIGTTVPFGVLTVIDPSIYAPSVTYGAAASLVVRATGGVELATAQDNAGPYGWWLQARLTSGAMPLLLNPVGGNVGMGTRNPAYKLDVVGDVNCTGAFRVNGTPFTGGAPGAWTAYTPAVTDNVGTAVTITSVAAFYVVFGSILFVQISFSFTGTANTNAINIALPVSIVANISTVATYIAFGAGTLNQAVIAAASNGTQIKVTIGSSNSGSSVGVYLGGTLRIS